jgi:hypothetical protein
VSGNGGWLLIGGSSGSRGCCTQFGSIGFCCASDGDGVITAIDKLSRQSEKGIDGWMTGAGLATGVMRIVLWVVLLIWRLN